MTNETKEPLAPSTVPMYDKGNDALRVDSFCELDDTITVAIRSFFRKLGAPHLVDERVVPTLRTDGASIFAAVRDRPWPPWGHGSRRIIGMLQVHPVGNNSFGLSPLYIRPEETSNIGMRAALYKETLEHLNQRPNAEVNYLVMEGAVLTPQILKKFGFCPSDDLVQTETARYFFYRAQVQTLLDSLQLAQVSIPELLAHQVKEEVMLANALFQGVLDWGRWRELIPISGGSFDAALPGGLPPSPPSAQIDIGGIGVVVNPL